MRDITGQEVHNPIVAKTRAQACADYSRRQTELSRLSPKEIYNRDVRLKNLAQMSGREIELGSPLYDVGNMEQE